MIQPDPDQSAGSQKLRNLTLAVVAGQVGCLTLVIVLLAVFLGLWLDARFNTRPAFTIGLLIVSVPFSLAAMFAVVRMATARMKTRAPGPNRPQEEKRIG